MPTRIIQDVITKSVIEDIELVVLYENRARLQDKGGGAHLYLGHKRLCQMPIEPEEFSPCCKDQITTPTNAVLEILLAVGNRRDIGKSVIEAWPPAVL